jgi:subtilisin-like proprotein convertase family protein
LHNPAFVPDSHVHTLTLSRLALAAALAVAVSEARGAEVSPELRRAFASGAFRVPVVVTLRSFPDARRPAVLPTDTDLANTGFERERRLANAPVATGWATGAAVAALAALPGVAHVGLDHVVRPTGQIGVAQIGADRLLAVGLTGVGRSIAVVDSGIDLQHPDLRRPDGTPWPGANLVDAGGDLADCSGHGTEVAGVLAGPQGIAPAAGLVVLKVFTARDGCKTARASDVLAAVDWAVSYAPGHDLDAINLSLADDSLHAGFCDSEDPASGAVFASARTAGLSVVAAAGNDGKTTGLPWPACLSTVASVGMVYSEASGPVMWGGVASCTDSVTGPDVVPCASNTGSALAALAPGVDWTTTTAGGGQSSGFSGTSAASPAAAGALVLARQARPLADPGVALDLLRATGVPVRDARTARTVPRLDLAATLDAAAPAAGDCTGAAIPDGAPEGIVCDAVVSSIVGNVSSLRVALAIDHPDASQLVVTLTSPDGTRATLVNRDRRAGEAVREVFGLTAAGDPLSAFAGRPAEGTWQLTVQDRVAGGAGRLVGWALFVEPTLPQTEPPFPFATSYVATAAHHFGKLGSFFTTDLRLFNSDSQRARPVTLRFVPTEPGSPPRTISVTLPPLGTRVLDDVIRNAFRTEGYGPVALNAAAPVLAVSRTSTTAPRGGSFGLAVPAERIASAATAAAGGLLVLVPAFKAAGFRVNVGVTEISGASANVEIVVRDSTGVQRALVPRTVPAGGLVQLNDVYALTSLAPDPADRIEVRVAGGAGRVAAWATPVDASSNDGSYFAAHAAASSLLIPAVARAAGAFGSRFVTDLKLSNAGPGPLHVRIAFTPTSGPAYDPVVVTLAGNETRAYDDVLGTLFTPLGDMSGALRLSALDPGGLYASTRTATTVDGRSFGLAIDPVQPSAQAGPGRQLALTFLSSSPVRRTNVGFVETAGIATRLHARLLATDGSIVAEQDLALDAFGALQVNDIFAAVGAPALTDASLLVDVLDGGAVVAYSILLDNRTNDGSYFSAALVP